MMSSKLSRTPTIWLSKSSTRKLAILMHPDRSRKPSAEDDFKALSEAYQVLIDKELRQRYDMYGRTADLKQGDLQDPRKLFAQFWGGQAFKDYCGELNMARVQAASDLYTDTDEAKKQRQALEQQAFDQQEARVQELKALFVTRIEGFHDPAPAAFHKKTWEAIESLQTAHLGASLLYIIGRTYAAKAKEYLGLKCGMLPGYVHQLRERQYITRSLWTVVKTSMDARQATDVLLERVYAGKSYEDLDEIASKKSHRALWEMFKFEIEATLRSVCDELLRDSKASNDEKQRRARALLFFGNTFMSRPPPSELESSLTEVRV
ncbi:X-domain of DnaJ-containing-domain-containing protein [Gongronella butleri]|nr:X-domain of DnaJ-containing-domain-containing protein [Gongronella butleri]